MNTQTLHLEYVEEFDVEQEVRARIADRIGNDANLMQIISRIAVNYAHFNMGKHNANQTDFMRWFESEEGRKAINEEQFDMEYIRKFTAANK